MATKINDKKDKWITLIPIKNHKVLHEKQYIHEIMKETEKGSTQLKNQRERKFIVWKEISKNNSRRIELNHLLLWLSIKFWD